MRYVNGGKATTITVHATDRIEDVKEEIQELMGWPVGGERLILNGRMLDDFKTIEDYSVQDGSTLRTLLGGDRGGSGKVCEKSENGIGEGVFRRENVGEIHFLKRYYAPPHLEFSKEEGFFRAGGK